MEIQLFVVISPDGLAGLLDAAHMFQQLIRNANAVYPSSVGGGGQTSQGNIGR